MDCFILFPPPHKTWVFFITLPGWTLNDVTLNLWTLPTLGESNCPFSLALVHARHPILACLSVFSETMLKEIDQLFLRVRSARGVSRLYSVRLLRRTAKQEGKNWGRCWRCRCFEAIECFRSDSIRSGCCPVKVCEGKRCHSFTACYSLWSFLARSSKQRWSTDWSTDAVVFAAVMRFFFWCIYFLWFALFLLCSFTSMSIVVLGLWYASISRQFLNIEMEKPPSVWATK